MASIFISYAEEDEDIAREITDDLNRKGAKVWISRASITEDTSSPEKIVKAINWSDVFILLWSEAASESHEVMFEWTNALNLRKPILTCLLKYRFTRKPAAGTAGKFRKC